jgi:hypothetical protein
MQKKQTVRRPPSRRRKAPIEKAEGAVESEKLFLSFWNICFDNLPEGAFTHRRLAPEEARRYIEEADRRKALACVSADDLLAPYRKHEFERHKDMCRVLEKHFGISLGLRKFLTRSDGLFFTKPLCLARVAGPHRLLVITCMYVLPERRGSLSGPPALLIDPPSVEFHLFQMPDAA